MEYVKKAVSEFEVTKQTDQQGDAVFIVHVLCSDSYIRLNRFYYSILQRFVNGETIEDIKRSSDVATVALELEEFVQILIKVELLKSGTEENLAETDDTPQKESLVNRIIQRLLQSTFSIKSPDAFVTSVYYYFGRILFTPVGLFLLLTLLVLGNTAFIGSFFHSHIAPVRQPPVFAVVSLVWVGAFVSVVLHELGHALTCKHFGRKISGFGLMFYLGIPGAFVDTSDAYFLTRGPRVAIDLAGLVVNLLIISLCGLCLFFGDGTFQAVFRLIAAINLFYVIWNLNPFVKYDGYYTLVDILEYPNLRQDALARVFSIKSAKDIVPLSWQDSTLLLFGIASLFFTAVILLVVSFYVYSILTRLIPSPYNAIFPAVAGLVLFSVLFRKAIKRMKISK